MTLRLLIFVFLTLSFQAEADEIFKKKMFLMGCNFEITVVANSQAEANQFTLLAEAEITRIENLISSWDSESETSRINLNAGLKPVKVAPELSLLFKTLSTTA